MKDRITRESREEGRTLLNKANTFLFQKAIAFLSDERGSLDQMVWVVGGAMVVAMIVVAALVYAPDTVQNLWDSATSTIMSKLGF